MFMFLLYQESSNFTISYHSSDRRVVDEILKFAEQELTRISENIGVSLETKIRIYILSSDEEVKKIHLLPDWGVGGAIPLEKVIIIKSPRIVKYPVNLRTLVAHEIAHIVLGNKCKNVRIPKWFDEGIAMYESKEWRLDDSIRLAWANFTNSILPLPGIERKFPKDSKNAELAYTESFSTISFIVSEFGKEAIKYIIQDMGQSSSSVQSQVETDFDQTLKNVLELSYTEFCDEWMKWVQQKYTAFNVLLNVFFPGVLLLIVFFIAVLLKMRQRKKVPLTDDLDAEI